MCYRLEGDKPSMGESEVHLTRWLSPAGRKMAQSRPGGGSIRCHTLSLLTDLSCLKRRNRNCDCNLRECSGSGLK